MSSREEHQARISKRTTKWTPLLGHLLWGIIHSICLTLRIRFVCEEKDNTAWKTEPVIVALWHNRTFVPCYIYSKLGFQPPMCVLTSASKDGALLETVAAHYNISAIRGSAHRRGATAFIEMMRYMEKGGSMCITPDGPKGPRYKTHPGIIKLASVSGIPIIPVCIDYSACQRISAAWDGYAIPVPFSDVTLRWGKAIDVPPNITDTELQTYCDLLAKRLQHGRPDFSPISSDL